MQTRDTKAVAKRIDKALIMLQQEVQRWISYDAGNPFLRALGEVQACYELTELETTMLCERYYR